MIKALNDFMLPSLVAMGTMVVEISPDLVIKRSYDVMDRSPSKQVTILQCLVAIAALVVEL